MAIPIMQCKCTSSRETHEANHKGSTRDIRYEHVEEVCKRLLKVSAVVLQHSIATTVRQIALEE